MAKGNSKKILYSGAEQHKNGFVEAVQIPIPQENDNRSDEQGRNVNAEHVNSLLPTHPILEKVADLDMIINHNHDIENSSAAFNNEDTIVIQE
ncbi:hypothetical protein A2U01_0039543, partial [Trifolium medium]|nr:hypothetical protein [Trifolium medium]